MARRKSRRDTRDTRDTRESRDGRINEQIATKSKRNKTNSAESNKGLLNKVVAKTAGQEALIEAIEQNEIVICNGPAGTGKTFISFGEALDHYFQGISKRIIIVRPTLAAGDDDNIGYLPGDLYEKMSPFLAPLMRDSAPQLLKPEVFRSFGDRNVMDPMLSLLARIDIEVVPLAFIRGRTFNNCFCILDEAQNCTAKDLRLFLTRIGRGTKTIIEGDSTQSDRDNSGLVEVMQRLHGMEQVGIVQLTEVDIIRNPLISQILRRLADD